MSNKEKVITAARSFVGAQWRHLGRKPWAVDCIGLVVLSLAAGGIVMRDRTNYGREPWRDGLQTDMREHFGQELPVEQMQAGDIVLMKWDDQPAPAHVGIITETDHGFSVIHSYSEISVTEHLIDADWMRRMVCVWRPNWSES